MTKESAVDRLTPRQRRFAEEYVIDFNGRQAAVRAGYPKDSASSVASKNTSRPDMQAAIRELLEEPRNQQALAHLKAVAFSNIKDYLQIAGNTFKFIDPARLLPEKAAAIKKFEVKEVADRKGRSRKVVTLELYDKMGPLIKLAKMLGLLSGEGKPHVDPAADEKKWREMKLEIAERFRSAMATYEKKKPSVG